MLRGIFISVALSQNSITISDCCEVFNFQLLSWFLLFYQALAEIRPALFGRVAHYCLACTAVSSVSSVLVTSRFIFISGLNLTRDSDSSFSTVRSVLAGLSNCLAFSNGSVWFCKSDFSCPLLDTSSS